MIGTRDLQALRARFDRAAATAGATRVDAAAFAALVDSLGEPHRHYHTLAHVEACLGWLAWFGVAAARRAEVELALWFHDAIYDPRRADNERRSAALAGEHLGGLGVPEVVIRRVAGLVLATEHGAGATT